MAHFFSYRLSKEEKVENEKEIYDLVVGAQSSSSPEERKSYVQQVIERFDPLINSLSSRFSNIGGSSKEDIYQQVVLRIIESVYDYDREKDNSVVRHIVCRARNSAWNYYKKDMNYFRPERTTVSLYEQDFGDDREVISLSKKHSVVNEDAILLSIIIDDKFSGLTERQEEVMRMFYLEDKSQYEIADELNINQSNVSRIIKRALRTLNKIKSQIEDEQS